MTQPSGFGTTATGIPVRQCRLEAGDLALEVIEYGATVRSLKVVGVETVLGFDTLVGYEADRSYQGAVVGRVANRIAGSRFSIDGVEHQVTANEGPNCLHGGALGLNKRVWRFVDVGRDSVQLAYRSPDGEEGFPGALEATVTFRLRERELEVEWAATTDRPTPVNLTQHLYFNLSGDPTRDILEHLLCVQATAFTPVRPDLIPTGQIEPVAGTPFDFRTAGRLRDAVFASDPQIGMGGGLDHNWCLDRRSGPAVTLQSPETGLTLDIETDQPGVQIYSGQGLGDPFAPFGGIAIEPQNFPDAINQAGFPEAVLRPGSRYVRRASYRFR